MIAVMMVFAWQFNRCRTVVKDRCCPNVVKNGSLFTKKIYVSAVTCQCLDRIIGGTGMMSVLTLAGVVLVVLPLRLAMAGP